MTIVSMDIQGYRGFATNQTLRPASPNSVAGSGLTILVGANNAGKSTVMEALRFFSGGQSPSFTEGRRNKKAGDKVSLRLQTHLNQVKEIRTVPQGGSESVSSHAAGPEGPGLRIFGLPSRRYFSPFGGGRGMWERDNFSTSTSTLARGERLDAFYYRLFRIQSHRAAFDAMLGRVLETVPNWTIEQSDQGNFYIKLAVGEAFHNSEGLGEGFVSLLFLIDSLYDSNEGDTIVIDEPELSLHPSLQRRLAKFLCEVASTRQIICATHSPYFITAEAIRGGATIARTYLEDHSSRIAHLNQATAQKLVQLVQDLNNPHVFGLDAREVFFLDDGVILVEGQEDVIAYQKISEQLGKPFRGAFFGWGVGGAEKMPIITQVLLELGFKKVVGILDGNKAAVLTNLKAQFPNYRFFAIPADDVRTKAAVPQRTARIGILDQNGAIRQEHKDAMAELVANVNAAVI